MAERRRPEVPAEVFDHGLQQERTALAWDRTALAMIVGGALFIRGGEAPYGDLRHLPGFVAILVGIWALGRSYRLYTRRHALLRDAASLTETGLILTVAAVTLALSVASVVLIVTSL